MKAVKSSHTIIVSVYNYSRTRINFSTKKLELFIKDILRQEKIKDASLNIFFVNNPLMLNLNKKFLRKNRSTDVLAFDLRLPGHDKSSLTGDCIVSVDAAKRVAKELSISLKEELCRYVIHGVLHLLGHNDHKPSDKKRMWKKQEEILKKIVF